MLRYDIRTHRGDAVRVIMMDLFRQLAREGHRAPIGTHLVLHQHPDHAEIVGDGERLGGVLVEAAQLFRTPMAVPLMDLTVEKDAMLAAMRIAPGAREAFHFAVPPEPVRFGLTTRMDAACAAIAHVAGRGDLLPMGMGIGPFSLMTKLVADPITPVFLAGTGAGPGDEPEVAVVEATLAVGTDLILGYLDAQLDAGAKAFILCEPAANLAYFSPIQLEESYAVFDRYVMEPLRRIKARLDERGAGLVFHNCGELTDGMVDRFVSVLPAMASLGSSRSLPEDAARFSKETVLYGNLPTKKFLSPELSVKEVRRLAVSLSEAMEAAGHPFILGSECDVLSVPGYEEEIMGKVLAFLGASL